MSVLGALLSIVVTAARAASPCVSKVVVRAPASYAPTVAQARALVCDSLASRIPGLQVAVAIDGRVVWVEAFGWADRERRRQVNGNTMFRIGSVSKPLTADAVAQLVAQGRLDLDLPVQRYAPSFPEKPWPITTRELAGHLAGIRHYRGAEFTSNRRYATVTAGLAIFKDDSLLFPPGTRFSYSTYGWNLISAVVEGASGEDFLAYMSRHVIRPLGLRHTAPDRADSVIPERTTFYEADSTGTIAVAPTVDNSYKWAGGGFLSTAEDLVRFGSAHLKPGWLSAQSLDLLFTPQHTSDGRATEYGVGWFVATDSLGHRIVYHGGGSVGGTTGFIVDRDAGIVFAVVTNLTNAPLGPARRIPVMFER